MVTARQAGEALLEVPLVIVVLSDDDGRHPARVTRAALEEAVAFANHAFASARIRFRFDDERDVTQAHHTGLNRLGAPPIADWEHLKRAGDALAAAAPGAITVLCRHGPGSRPAGNGFAGTDSAFVVMPGTEDARHCGRPHVDLLAHELGHYLGLDHTFRGEPFPHRAAAEAHFLAHGRDPTAFDGDGLEDTAPDPAIRSLECDPADSVELAGAHFPLPRRNLMSYYAERCELSPAQAARTRWMLAERLRHPSGMRPVNRPAGAAHEFEHLKIVEAQRTRPSGQVMAGYGVGDWCGDAQLFVGAEPGGVLTFELPPAPGSGAATLYATRAPDFGRLEVRIDGAVAGDVLDLYAPRVMPSGPLPLPVDLSATAGRQLSFRVVGRHPRSRGWHFGLDALTLHRRGTRGQ